MSIREQIENDLTVALKGQETEVVSVLRMVKSAVKNTEIDKGHELDDAELISVLDKQVKQRQDSIVQFEAGNRKDLVAKEEFELNIIKKYLPEKMSEPEVRKIVTETISELNAGSLADMGKVMKSVLAKAQGNADASMVSSIVREILS